MIKPLSPNAMECLWQLFRNGPTWDGDICTKAGRGELFEYGLAYRVDGWSFITKEGMDAALAAKYDRQKERYQRAQRRAA